MSAVLPGVIPDKENLARFVIARRWVRENRTVKPDAFMPPPDLNFSVTRHAALSIDELWARGRCVATEVGKTLYGRADVSAMEVRDAKLNAIEHRLDDNPEHAHIVGWPSEKPAQKLRAQQLAAVAGYAEVTDRPVQDAKKAVGIQSVHQTAMPRMALQATGGLLILCGLVAGLILIGFEQEKVGTVFILLAVLLGLPVYILARFGAWWRHR